MDIPVHKRMSSIPHCKTLDRGVRLPGPCRILFVIRVTPHLKGQACERSLLIGSNVLWLSKAESQE
jgi:hypothetical protein